RLRRHDGSHRWLMDHGVPLYDEDVFVGYIGSCVDVEDRKRAEEEVQAAEKRATEELDAMTRLHALAGRLASCGDLHAGRDDVLAGAIATTHADKGNIQIYDPDRKVLEIAVHRGFGPEFLEHFRTVAAGSGSACGRALASGDATVIEDVDRDPDFEPHRAIARANGYRAVHSTILKTATGGILGMLSVHFRDPGRPAQP